jgi:hypothetical protein
MELYSISCDRINKPLINVLASEWAKVHSVLEYYMKVNLQCSKIQLLLQQHDSVYGRHTLQYSLC